MTEAESGPALPSDAELITAIRSGDMAAYGELYRRHVASARSLARQLVRGPAEVDDVVAETFSRVLDLMRRGGGPQDAFRPYLLTEQLQNWQGLLRTPTYWAPITHSAWVCALYGLPALFAGYLVLLRRDVAGG